MDSTKGELEQWEINTYAFLKEIREDREVLKRGLDEYFDHVGRKKEAREAREAKAEQERLD